MDGTKEKLKDIQKDLEWVTFNDRVDSRDKFTSKGIFGFLVPLGCVVTAGILGYGLYNMIKRDSRKQQLLMRYRVAAQGITVLLATAGFFFSSPPSK